MRDHCSDLYGSPQVYPSPPLPRLSPSHRVSSMSYPDPPPTPSPSEPKSPYEFDAAKWEHQQMAENGGVERTSYLPRDPFQHSPLCPALVVSVAYSIPRSNSPLLSSQSIIDDDLFDDPNIDLDAEYLGQSVLVCAPACTESSPQRTSPHTPKCAPPSPTPTTPICRRAPFALGFSACYGQSSYQA